MLIETPGIVCAVRAHGEHGAVVRVLTPGQGLLAGYVRGARSRALRPVLFAGNDVACQFRLRTAEQLPSLTVELSQSRAMLMAEPLAADAMVWATTLVAAVLPEGHPYPRLFEGLEGLLMAIGAAPAARGWAVALVGFERLVLAELGYGRMEEASRVEAEWLAILPELEASRIALATHILGDRRADVMAARDRLTDRLKRAVA